MLIGLTGLAGSGKSEIANVLINEMGFTRVKFADPLKNMVRGMLADMGYCRDDVERMIEGDLKEALIPELNVTPRHIMVTLGTEWGRNLIQRDLWARLWSAKVEALLTGGGMRSRVVVDDVRFPNEVNALRYHGGKLWRIERPGLTSNGHESESLDVPADLTIINDRSLEGLRSAARAMAAGTIARSRPEPTIPEMLAAIKRKRAAMPPAERAELERRERQAQRESFVRGMTTPCEHGVLDFEQCGDCRGSHSCS